MTQKVAESVTATETLAVISEESGEKPNVCVATVSGTSTAGRRMIRRAESTDRPPKAPRVIPSVGWMASATMCRAGPVGVSHVTAAPAATRTGSNPRSDLRAREERRCSTAVT